jgi:hypothetical protein
MRKHTAALLHGQRRRSAADGVHVAEGEKGIANAVRNVFDTAHVADTTDLGACTDGTITERTTRARQKQRIGAV